VREVVIVIVFKQCIAKTAFSSSPFAPLLWILTSSGSVEIILVVSDFTMAHPMWGPKIWFCDNVGLLAKGLSPQKLIWVITVGCNEEARQYVGETLKRW
jgi:hypothetical protein